MRLFLAIWFVFALVRCSEGYSSSSDSCSHIIDVTNLRCTDCDEVIHSLKIRNTVSAVSFLLSLDIIFGDNVLKNLRPFVLLASNMAKVALSRTAFPSSSLYRIQSHDLLCFLEIALCVVLEFLTLDSSINSLLLNVFLGLNFLDILLSILASSFELDRIKWIHEHRS